MPRFARIPHVKGISYHRIAIPDFADRLCATVPDHLVIKS
jgi:hypothetical protein